MRSEGSPGHGGKETRARGRLGAGCALPDQQAGGNDQLKANEVQIFKTKSVTSFKTV